MGLTTKEIGSSSFNDMISSVDRRNEYVENRANANVTLNNFLTPYTLDNKSSILNAPCGYSNGVYASLRPIKTIGPELVTNGTFDTDSDWDKGTGWSISGGKANSDGVSSNSNLATTSAFYSGTVQVKMTISVTNYVGGTLKIYLSSINFASITENGEYTFYTTADRTDGRLFIKSNNFIGSIDNVSVKEVTDADFDFTRGSSATRVNEKGLIEDVQILSGELVQNGDFEEIGSELINLDTAVYQSGWQNNNDGSATFDINNGTGSEVIQIGVLQVGKTYKFSYDINFTGAGKFRLYTQNFFASNVIQSGTYTGTFIADGTNIRFKRITGDLFTIDNVSVKEVGQNWTVANDDANNYVEFNQDEGTVRLKFLNTSPLTTLTSDTQYLSGKKYKLKVDVQEVVSGAIKIDAAGVSQTYNSAGVQEAIIEPTGNSNVSFYRATADVDITLNSVSLIEITDDTDIPRIDYTDGTGALLLEPQSTNKVTQSETFSTWSTYKRIYYKRKFSGT